MANKDFGAGIFDEPEPVVLSDREIALAKGEDPDAVPPKDDAADDNPDQGEPAEPAEPEGKDEAEGKDETKAKDESEAAEDKGGKEAVAQGDPADKASDAAQGGEALDPLSSIIASLDQHKLDIEKIEDDWKDEDGNITDPHSLSIIKSLEATQKAVRDVTAMMKQAVEEGKAAEAQNKARQEFHATLDEHEADFGVGSKQTAEQRKNREKVQEKVELLYSGYTASGGKIPTVKEITEEAIVLAIGPRKGGRSEALKRQSQHRRTTNAAGGTTQRVAAPDPDSAAALANHPTLKKKWESYQEQNGNY